MKVIILNYGGCYVEVADVPMEYAKAMDEGKMDDTAALAYMGYDLDGIHWMFSEDDQFPVFWKNEVIPYVTL